MWDFEIGHALALMGRTLPFILLRIAVYAGIAIAYVVATGLGAGLGGPTVALRHGSTHGLWLRRRRDC